MMKPLEIAFHCADAAEDKQGSDILILDMRAVSSVADYFLICAGATDRQVKAIADEIRKRLKEKGIECSHAEGERDGNWVVLDFFDVIVHIFSQETREYYQLERLWGDAQKILNPGKKEPLKKKSGKNEPGH